jgi:hypothetical protein
MEAVYPVCKIFIISILPWSSWQTIGSMVGSVYMYQVKVEGKDGDNPSIDAHTGGDIRVR